MAKAPAKKTAKKTVKETVKKTAAKPAEKPVVKPAAQAEKKPVRKTVVAPLVAAVEKSAPPVAAKSPAVVAAAKPGLKRPHVFIQTNAKQAIGAIVSAWSMKRNSAHADDFDVTIIHKEDFPYFQAREGQNYMRHGNKRKWLNEDLQSFTITRFLPPSLMGYEGRALVVDPDVFAVADVWDLLTRNMGGKAILCRGSKFKNGAFATSVMLLDCAKLKHWNVEKGFNELFEGKRDYHNWMSLLMEDRNTIGTFENEWNDFDKLTPATKMVHNTHRRTQPWKTGLKVDYTPTEFVPVIGQIMKLRRKIFGEHAFLGRYHRHPDVNQENLFFGLLKECLDQGKISRAEIEKAMRSNYVRHDAFEVMAKVPALEKRAA